MDFLKRTVRGFSLSGGSGDVYDIAIDRCDLAGCMIATSEVPERRLTVSNCRVRSTKYKNCFVGPIIVRESVFTDIRGPSLFCYGTAFDRVKFEGTCGVLSILPVAVPGSYISTAEIARVLKENSELEKACEWSIDISSARFDIFEAYGLAIEKVRVHEDDLVLSSSALEQFMNHPPINSMATIAQTRIVSTKAQTAVISARQRSQDIAQLRDIKNQLNTSAVHSSVD